MKHRHNTTIQHLILKEVADWQDSPGSPEGGAIIGWPDVLVHIPEKMYQGWPQSRVRENIIDNINALCQSSLLISTGGQIGDHDDYVKVKITDLGRNRLRSQWQKAFQNIASNLWTVLFTMISTITAQIILKMIWGIG